MVVHHCKAIMELRISSKGSVHKDYDIVPKDARSLRVSWNFAPKGSGIRFGP